MLQEMNLWPLLNPGVYEYFIFGSVGKWHHLLIQLLRSTAISAKSMTHCKLVGLCGEQTGQFSGENPLTKLKISRR